MPLSWCLFFFLFPVPLEGKVNDSLIYDGLSLDIIIICRCTQRDGTLFEIRSFFRHNYKGLLTLTQLRWPAVNFGVSVIFMFVLSLVGLSNRQTWECISCFVGKLCCQVFPTQMPAFKRANKANWKKKNNNHASCCKEGLIILASNIILFNITPWGCYSHPCGGILLTYCDNSTQSRMLCHLMIFLFISL